ncbi:anthrax toxin receptor-like [Cavia porcellus]|uniref:anthrax toxin receptor-like n=1 Tax=Cavia porcellus TaxID=10141 RepID=UPI002FE0C67D
MGRHRPCSALFLPLLLLLHLPLLSTGSTPKPSSLIGQGIRSASHPLDLEAQQSWQASQRASDCWGAFDLYFVLDKSGSIDNNWINIYLFVENVVARFKNPNLRISFIVFSRDAEVIMPLTEDRVKIHEGLNRLQWVVPGGYTFMQEGFKQANEEIMRARYGGRKVASVIIVLTDGMLMADSFRETREEAERSRSMGATVFTVGVLDYDKNQLTAIADSAGHMFGVDSGFKGLQNIVDALVSKSCLEVTSVRPSSLCVGEPYTVVFTGQGFHNAKGPDQVICRFKFSPTNIFDQRATSVEDTTIMCPGPRIDQAGQELSVELSLNSGASFIGSKSNISSTDCMNTRKLSTSIKSYLKYLPLLLLIPLLLLLCCCCWWLWKRRQRKRSPPQPVPEPEKEPPNTCRKEKDQEEDKRPPPPPAQPPPQPPVNTSPTVIVSCCGCGARTAEDNLDSCCTCVYPGCQQMPMTWNQPRAPGRCTDITLLSAPCAQGSCGQKICLQSNRKCCQPTQPAYSSRTCHQPNREGYPVPRASYNPRIYLQPSGNCFPAPEVPYTPNMYLVPNQENVPRNIYARCQLPAKCSDCTSRVLPLLSPLTRKSAESFSPSKSYRSPSRSKKIYD